MILISSTSAKILVGTYGTTEPVDISPTEYMKAKEQQITCCSFKSTTLSFALCCFFFGAVCFVAAFFTVFFTVFS
jgi:hypothetical protein